MPDTPPQLDFVIEEPGPRPAPPAPPAPRPDRAAALVRRLPAGSPLREHAGALLAGAADPRADPETLLAPLRRISMRRWREQMVAAWALGRSPLTEDAARQAGKLLADLLHCRTRRDLSGFAMRPNVRSGLLWPVYILAFGGWGILAERGYYLWTCASLVASAPLLVWLYLGVDRLGQARGEAARALARLGRVEGVSHLAYALFCGEQRDVDTNEVRLAAQEALPALLARLAPADYAGLDAEAVPLLCRALEHKDPWVAWSVLGALEAGGDSRAIGPVEKLARRFVPVRERIRHADTTAGLKAEAARILPVLYERKRREEDARKLLRPADAPDRPGASLLRPAGSPPLDDPDALLRPAEQESEDG